VERSPNAQGYHWNSNAETCYFFGQAMGGTLEGLLAVKTRLAWTPHQEAPGGP
jgi:hypothetical protein